MTMQPGELSFLDLQNAVKSDRFREGQRTDIKRALNFRYWWLWTLQPWTFTEGETLVAVTSGSMAVTNLPTDIREPYALYRADGHRLRFVSRDAFYGLYYDSLTVPSGAPCHWSRVAASLYVGPPSNETSTVYKLLYDKEFTPLIEDTDVPALPVGAHLGLVFGASASMAKLQNDPTAIGFENDFAEVVEMLQAGYSRDQTGDSEQFGGDWSGAQWR